MKAVAWVQQSGRLELVEVPEPTLEGPSQVLVQVLQVGVCGTDRAIARGAEEVEPPPGADYLVLGHEMVGGVEEVGPGVTGLKAGHLVVASVRRGCGECESCRHGESDLCYTGRFKERGILGAHGFMTSWVVEEESNLVALPPSLEGVGFLAEPLSTSEKALQKARQLQGRLRPRCGHPEHGWDQETWGGCKRALVAGAGPIGMLMAFLLRLHEVATTVVATQPSDSAKGRLARSVGAEYLSLQEVRWGELWPSLGALDLAVEATGAPQVALELAQGMQSPNCVLLLLGVPDRSPAAPVDVSSLVRRLVLSNQAVLGSVNANLRHLRMAVQHLAQFQRQFGKSLDLVVSQTYPLEEFRQAFFHPPRDAIKVSLAP